MVLYSSPDGFGAEPVIPDRLRRDHREAVRQRSVTESERGSDERLVAPPQTCPLELARTCQGSLHCYSLLPFSLSVLLFPLVFSSIPASPPTSRGRVRGPITAWAAVGSRADGGPDPDIRGRDWLDRRLMERIQPMISHTIFGIGAADISVGASKLEAQVTYCWSRLPLYPSLYSSSLR